jgi:hypothetical protein
MTQVSVTEELYVKGEVVHDTIILYAEGLKKM